MIRLCSVRFGKERLSPIINHNLGTDDADQESGMGTDEAGAEQGIEDEPGARYQVSAEGPED